MIKPHFSKIKGNPEIHDIILKGMVKKFYHNLNLFPEDTYVFNIKYHTIIFDKFKNEIIIFNSDKIPVYLVENINVGNLEQLPELIKEPALEFFYHCIEDIKKQQEELIPY